MSSSSFIPIPALRALLTCVVLQIWTDKKKQREMGDTGGVEVLLQMCNSEKKAESALLEPVAWSLRNCLHNNNSNTNRFLHAGGLETLTEVSNRKTPIIRVSMVMMVMMVVGVVG